MIPALLIDVYCTGSWITWLISPLADGRLLLILVVSYLTTGLMHVYYWYWLYHTLPLGWWTFTIDTGCIIPYHWADGRLLLILVVSYLTTGLMDVYYWYWLYHTLPLADACSCMHICMISTLNWFVFVWLDLRNWQPKRCIYMVYTCWSSHVGV